MIKGFLIMNKQTRKTDHKNSNLVMITRHKNDNQALPTYTTYYAKEFVRGRKNPRLHKIGISTEQMSLTVMRQRTVKYLTDLGKYGRSEYTLDKAFNEIYLPDLKHRKVKTIPEIVRNYNVDLKDRFGSYKLEEIKSVDLLKWFNETSTRSKGAANNCSTLLKALFKLCIKADIGLSVDPTSVLTKNPDIKRVRTLNKLEVIRLKEALNEAKNKSLYAWSFIMVLYLTGARKGELAKATWEDYINGQLVLREHKTDNKTNLNRVIYLNELAISIINNLPKDNKTIFKIKDPKKVWDFIRHKADIPDFRMHDFRHNFASLGINNGIEMIRVAKLTGHKSIISMQRYQHVNEATALEDNKLLGNILTD